MIDVLLPLVQPSDYDPRIARVGLIGQPGSGKGEVCKLFVERGFEPYSCGDIVRAEAERQAAIEPDLDDLTFAMLRQEPERYGRAISALLSMKMCRSYGPDVLVQPLLDATSHAVLDGVRTFWDFLRIHCIGGFLVALDCDEDIRRKYIENDPHRSGGRKPIDNDEFVIESCSENGAAPKPVDYSLDEASYFLPDVSHIMRLVPGYRINNSEPGLENLRRSVNPVVDDILSRVATRQTILG